MTKVTRIHPVLNRRSTSVDLVVPENFIRAIRESGYIGLSTALAELVDNSLQAGAKTVDVSVSRDRPEAAPRIVVEDDGSGMNEEDLTACLRFGGSSRFDSRRSFGRFGMGLPAASLSQARVVEVTAWQKASAALRVRLDVDAVAKGDSISIEPEAGIAGVALSGCRVEWMECDRIHYKRLVWLERLLHKELGRLFRRFLGQGFVLRINGREVSPVDPMLLTAKVNGECAQLAFEPLRYEIASESGEVANVTVSFAILPVARWHDLDNSSKREVGIVGQGGVSILRAGREIASGWYLMGQKRKENYDDWWRCEIEFEPALDEQFGITINKQGIRPSETLRDALESDLEAIARLLNARVRQAFEEVKFEAAVEGSCRIAAVADADLPLIRKRGHVAGALSYHLGADQLTGESMLGLTLKNRDLRVTMNVDHPAFGALYRPLQEMGDAGLPIRTALELLFLSLARSLAAVEPADADRQELLEAWGLIYGRMLAKS